MQNPLFNIANTNAYVRMYMECALQINTYAILIKIKDFLITFMRIIYRTQNKYQLNNYS